MNVNLEKYVIEFENDENIYNRKIVEGLILNTFRYAKHINSNHTINSALAKYIFNKLSPQYFDPIDARTLVNAYFEAYNKTLDDVKSFINSELMLLIIYI